MTPQPVTVSPTDELADVATVLLDRGLRAVPVVQDQRLVGIISRHDILSYIAQQRQARLRGEDPMAAIA
jgi:CBS domain-containing protein